MKTKWISKGLTSLLVVGLVFSTASFASAKEQDSKKNEQKDLVQKEDQSSKDKEKKNVIKSEVGKTVEKRLNNVESSIKSITQSINSFFGVTEDGTVDKELSQKTTSEKYNSYKGKLQAEINKLRAIDKQLASDKKKSKVNTSEFDALATKSKELQKLAKDEIERVKSLAEQASTPKTEDETTTPTDPAV